MFLKPQKISIVDIKKSPKGRRLSLEGIVIEVSINWFMLKFMMYVVFVKVCIITCVP